MNFVGGGDGEEFAIRGEGERGHLFRHKEGDEADEVFGSEISHGCISIKSGHGSNKVTAAHCFAIAGSIPCVNVRTCEHRA